MQSTSRTQLLQFAHVLQSSLFPRVEDELGPLGERAQLFVAVMGMVPLSRYLAPVRGRPSKDRHAIATAFLAKAVYGLETTRQVLDRWRTDRQLRCLCGWREARQIPHESTFSRTLAEFAATQLPQHLHEALIRDTQHGRLVGHIARDSTAIEAREKFPEMKPGRSRRKRRPKRAKAAERGTR